MITLKPLKGPFTDAVVSIADEMLSRSELAGGQRGQDCLRLALQRLRSLKRRRRHFLQQILFFRFLLRARIFSTPFI